MPVLIHALCQRQKAHSVPQIPTICSITHTSEKRKLLGHWSFHRLNIFITASIV